MAAQPKIKTNTTTTRAPRTTTHQINDTIEIIDTSHQAYGQLADIEQLYYGGAYIRTHGGDNYRISITAIHTPSPNNLAYLTRLRNTTTDPALELTQAVHDNAYEIARYILEARESEASTDGTHIDTAAAIIEALAKIGTL